jgi:hypothetical protein
LRLRLNLRKLRVLLLLLLRASLRKLRVQRRKVKAVIGPCAAAKRRRGLNAKK